MGKGPKLFHIDELSQERSGFETSKRVPLKGSIQNP